MHISTSHTSSLTAFPGKYCLTVELHASSHILFYERKCSLYVNRVGFTTKLHICGSPGGDRRGNHFCMMVTVT
jgi:hypothetical protein